jgi:hypothetical protein
MKLITVLSRLLPLGLLDCCLPAATIPAPGGSQYWKTQRKELRS